MRDKTHPRLRERYCALGVGCVTGVLSLLAVLPTAATAQGTAQGVFGKLLDGVAGKSVVSAQVVLADSAGNVVGRTLSNTAGHFFIAVDIGTYTLLVSRLGYETVRVTDVTITNGSVLPLRIHLSPDAVELPGLVVEGEREESYLRLNGFYERQDLGFGNFIEVDELQRLQTLVVSDLLRKVPSLWINDEGEVRSRRGAWIGGQLRPCLLQIVVDGMYRGIHMDEALLLKEIQAIEVYHGLSNYPAQWQALALGNYLDHWGEVHRTCGLVVVWTKH